MVITPFAPYCLVPNDVYSDADRWGGDKHG